MNRIHANWLLLAVVVAIMPSFVRAAISEEDAEKLKSAQAAFDEKDFQQALETLQPLAKTYPDEGEIPRLMAHAYYELKRYPEARSAAMQAIANGRVTSDLLAWLVQIDRQSDDKLATVNTVRLLTIIDKDNFTWRMLYGDLLGDLESPQASAGVYRQLLEEHPDSVPLQLRLGNALVQMGRDQEAASALETAWHLGKTDPRVAGMLAGLWQRMGNEREALSWSKRAADLGNGTDQPLELQVARLQWDLGLTEQARATAAKLVDSPDQDIKAKSLVLLGQIAMQENQLAQAMDHWRKAIAAGAESRQLFIAVGAHHFNEGEYALAAITLQRALPGSVDALQASDEQPLRFLVISLIQEGDRDAARSYLRQYLELNGLTEDTKQLVRLWTAAK